VIEPVNIFIARQPFWYHKYTLVLPLMPSNKYFVLLGNHFGTTILLPLMPSNKYYFIARQPFWYHKYALLLTPSA